MGRLRRILLTSAAIATAAAAVAAETVTYSYDARGRLIKIVRSGTVNNGVATSYTHDKADNRKTRTTAGAP
jgi:hypothetical protein